MDNTASTTLEAFRERFFGRRPKPVPKTTHPSTAQSDSTTSSAATSEQTASTTSAAPEQSAHADIWHSRWDRAPTDWKRFLSSMEKVFALSDSEESKIHQRNLTYISTPDLTPRAWLGTNAIILLVGSFSKVLLSGLNRMHTYNLPALHDVIERRTPGRGLLTVSNHQSVMDDPFLLGSLLPTRILVDSARMRWGLCSLDICFQDALVSRVLRLGKAMPIQRRGGIDQHFLRVAGEKLSAGDWVHIFPEGRVRQRGMGYCKRGVGKVLAMAYEAKQRLPLVVPMYHEGIEKVMPQKLENNELESGVPRTGKDLFVMVGEPLDLTPVFNRLMPACQASGGTATDSAPCLRLYEEVADFLALTMRLLRAETRQRVQKDHNVDLGAPYEYS